MAKGEREPLLVPIGTVVRNLRMDHRLTLDSLAARSDLGKRTIQQIERSNAVRADTLQRVATALDVGLDSLVFDIESTTKLLINDLYVNYDENALQFHRHLISDDVRFWISGDRSKIPFAGEYVGFDQARLFFQRLFGEIEKRSTDRPPTVANFVVDRPNNKVVIDLEDDIVRRRNAPGRTLSCKVKCTFQYRDAKLVYFEDLFDTSAWEKFLN